MRNVVEGPASRLKDKKGDDSGNQELGSGSKEGNNDKDNTSGDDSSGDGGEEDDSWITILIVVLSVVSVLGLVTAVFNVRRKRATPDRSGGEEQGNSTRRANGAGVELFPRKDCLSVENPLAPPPETHELELEPEPVSSTPTPPPPAAPDAARVWETLLDPASGNSYYHNTMTGETSWVRPSEYE